MTTIELAEGVLGAIDGVRPVDAAPRDDDASVVARAIAGDRRAEELLYHRHVGYVAGLLFRLVRDRADAEDALQETFVIALDRLASLRDPSALRGWLAQIAVSRARRIFRRQRLLRVLGFVSAPKAREEAADAHRPSEDWIALHEIVAQIAADERIAWWLRHVEGYEIDEVAAACDCSASTAKRRIRAADAFVRTHFESCEAAR